MRPDRKVNVYLPIEISVRELASKFYLGAYLNTIGFRVFIGEKSQVVKLIKMLEGGIYLEKSLQPGKAPKLQKLRDMGCSIVNLCEEGLMFFSSADYMNRKVGEAEFELVDFNCCWGRAQEMALASLSDASVKNVVTGNPRMALSSLGFYEDGKADDPEKIVLLNTKFARTNYVGVDRSNPFEWVKNQEKKGYVPTVEQLDLMYRSVRQERAVMEGFVSLARSFDACAPKSMKLVVRPHPAEEVSFWEDIVCGLDRVVVDQTGDVGDAINRASIVISNNCTTSVEAVLTGRVSINYRPFVDEVVEYPLPRSIGFQVFDERELFELLYERESGVTIHSCGSDAVSWFVDKNYAAYVTRIGDIFEALAFKHAGSMGLTKLDEIKIRLSGMGVPYSQADVIDRSKFKFQAFKARGITSVCERILNMDPRIAPPEIRFLNSKVMQLG